MVRNFIFVHYGKLAILIYLSFLIPFPTHRQSLSYSFCIFCSCFLYLKEISYSEPLNCHKTNFLDFTDLRISVQSGTHLATESQNLVLVNNKLEI